MSFFKLNNDEKNLANSFDKKRMTKEEKKRFYIGISLMFLGLLGFLGSFIAIILIDVPAIMNSQKIPRTGLIPILAIFISNIPAFLGLYLIGKKPHETSENKSNIADEASEENPESNENNSKSKALNSEE